MAKFQNGISIACADTYFSACKRLPPQVLRDEINFREKFMKDPTSRGLNYEKIIAADKNLRSVRVNGSYRAIVKIPDSDTKNIYTLMWIDSHDEAYEWASKKHIGVNDVTNAIEIYDVIEKENITTKIPHDEKMPKLFDNIKDADLARIGVLDNLLWVVRAIQTLDDLKRAEQFLTSDIFEYISYLANDIPIEEVIDMLIDSNKTMKSKMSFEEAITEPQNLKHFYIIDTEASANEFSRILEAPLEEWRIFLHPTQRNIVTKNYSGSVRIIGGAGTGKTVVAMHRAKWLAENFCTEHGDKILFTTYTSNLAEDIRANLKILCSSSVFSKIEVINLDKWVSDFLSIKRVPERLVFGEEVKELWTKAIELVNPSTRYPIGFYIDEYEKVLLAKEISSFEEYRASNRVGRGIPLNRSQKLEVWDVVQSYRQLLVNTNTIDNFTATIRVKDIITTSSEYMPYKSVIVDEGQDFGDSAYKLIRAIAGNEHENDIFIVGDAHQRIYGKKVILNNCGINTVGRSGVLKINYRTTEEIRSFANSIIKDMVVDDLEGEIDEGSGYISFSHGKQPEILNFKFQEDEYAAIYEIIQKWIGQGTPLKSICIVARIKKQIESIRKYLNNKGICVYEIKNTKTDEPVIDGIRIATMHRVKGLEFDCVIVSDVNNGVVPLNTFINTSTDNINKKELIDAERQLLYVALTRAKKEVIITSFGRPSIFIENISE